MDKTEFLPTEWHAEKHRKRNMPCQLYGNIVASERMMKIFPNPMQLCQLTSTLPFTATNSRDKERHRAISSYIIMSTGKLASYKHEAIIRKQYRLC